MKLLFLHNKDLVIVFLLTLFTVHFINAQRTISLEEAIATATENNRSIQVAKQEAIVAKANYHKSLGIILPQLNLSHNALTTNDPLNAFGFKLQQQQITMADFDPNLLNNPSKTNIFLTKAEVLQPLLNIDGFYGRKAAKNGVDATNNMAIHIQNKTIVELKKVYSQLQLMNELVKVYQFAEKTILENKKVANNFYEQGFLKKNDLLEIEIHVVDIQNQLLNAEKLFKDTSAYLNFLLGTNESILLVPSESLMLNTQPIDLSTPLTSERADLKAVQNGLSAQKELYNMAKSQFIPRINAFANYNWTDDQLFQTNSNSYLLGIQLSWDLFKGFQNLGEVQKQKATTKIAEINADSYENYSKMELENAKRHFINTKNSLKLNSLAKDHAEEALKIRKNRFNQGLEKTSDLLMAETTFVQKRLAYLQAIFEYNHALSNVQFLLNQ